MATFFLLPPTFYVSHRQKLKLLTIRSALLFYTNSLGFAIQNCNKKNQKCNVNLISFGLLSPSSASSFLQRRIRSSRRRHATVQLPSGPMMDPKLFQMPLRLRRLVPFPRSRGHLLRFLQVRFGFRLLPLPARVKSH